MDNWMIAQRLSRQARELARQGGNLYRMRAYRQAAQTILGLDESVEAILADGDAKRLRALPGIGCHLAVVIEHLVRTGEFHTFTDVLAERELAGTGK